MKPLLLLVLVGASLWIDEPKKPATISIPSATATEIKQKFEAARQAQAEAEAAKARFEARAAEWREAITAARYQLDVPKDWVLDGDKLEFSPPKKDDKPTKP